LQLLGPGSEASVQTDALSALKCLATIPENAVTIAGAGAIPIHVTFLLTPTTRSSRLVRSPL
jgi:hypothetical protein